MDKLLFNFHFSKRYFFKSALFTLLYVIAANFGLTIATINNNVSPIWPPTGLAFAIVFIYGRKYWPAIALGAFVANIMAGSSLLTVIPITIGNTAEAVFGLWLFHRLSKQTELFGNHTFPMAVILSSALAAMISAFIGVTSLCLNNVIPVTKATEVAVTWWSGDALGGIIFFPLILLFHPKFSKHKINLLTLATIAMVSFFVAWPILMTINGGSYIFLIFPLLMFAGLIEGEKGLAVATASILAVSYLSVRASEGAFHAGISNAHLINLQLFQFALAITSLFLNGFFKIESVKLPAISLISGWLVSGIIFSAFYNQNQKMTDVEFTNIVTKVEAHLKARMDINVIALKSGAAFFAGSDSVTVSDWKDFTDKIELEIETF